jgi:hypothetical protein
MKLRAKVNSAYLDQILEGTKKIEYRQIESMILVDENQREVEVEAIQVVRVHDVKEYDKIIVDHPNVPWDPEMCIHKIYLGEVLKVEHDCRSSTVKLIKPVYGFDESRPRSDSLGIYRCVCGKYWMIRYQYDPGCGSDNIWLAPGEKKRGYEFTEEELKEAEGIYEKMKT